MKKLFLHWLPVFLYSSLIFYLSSRSDVHAEHDKIAHTAAYTVLCLLFLWALRLHVKSLPALLLFAVLLTTFYGVGDEYHQSFVPGRESSIYDVMADFLGSMLGVTFYVLATRFSKHKSPA